VSKYEDKIETAVNTRQDRTEGIKFKKNFNQDFCFFSSLNKIPLTKFIYTYIVFGISQIAKQNKIKINFLSSAMSRLVPNNFFFVSDGIFFGCKICKTFN
jgi:hypothetical protein